MNWKQAYFDILHVVFDRQFPALPTGEFLNPQLVCETADFLEFRCFYDNYDNEDDEWTWYYDKKSGKFYN